MPPSGMQNFEVESADLGERRAPFSLRKCVATSSLIGAVAAVGLLGRAHTSTAKSVVFAKSAETANWGSTACADVETQSDFNLTEYIRASWYIQKQQVNGYQPEERLNCVVATYNETYHGTPSTVPFFGGTVLTVFNDCNVGSKNGPVSNNYTSPDFERSFGSPLCARQTNEEHPERLSVAPCALPNFLAGNYWVLHAGPSPDNYEYAAVIAGQPTVEKEDGCTTPDTCSGPAQTGCGLWLFTREPVPDVSKVAHLEEILHTKGVSTQLLKEIDHTGCQYEGYFMKADARQRVIV